MHKSHHLLAKLLVVGFWWSLFSSGGPEHQTPANALQTQTVKLGMIVIDDSKHSVEDVKQEDIEIVEEGVPQKISLFARDERPIQYVIVVDNSGSFRSLLQSTLQAVVTLIENNRPDDQTMLVRFISCDRIETVEKFTNDKSKLLTGLKSFRPEGGQTAFIDALYLSTKAVVEYRLTDPSVRRVLVVVSDGEERSSFYSANALNNLMREQDVQVFIIGVVKQLSGEGGYIRPSPRVTAENLLKHLTEETGGRVFFPKTGKELEDAASEIAHDLHSQYLVGFERQTEPAEKGFRKLKVRLAPTSQRKELKFVTRPGYWLNVEHPLPVEPKKKSP
jgi:Ca-activated chloride channel family protein